MRYLRSFAAFWYDFIVGDDWRLATGVVLALGLTAAVAQLSTFPAWWLAPVVALLILVVATVRAGRKKAKS
jgi:hypothetical protein